jgi:hypothetical protein
MRAAMIETHLHDGILEIVIDNPPVNVLDRQAER